MSHFLFSQHKGWSLSGEEEEEEEKDCGGRLRGHTSTVIHSKDCEVNWTWVAEVASRLVHQQLPQGVYQGASIPTLGPVH